MRIYLNVTVKNKYLVQIIANKKIMVFSPMQKLYNIESTKYSCLLILNFPFSLCGLNYLQWITKMHLFAGKIFCGNKFDDGKARHSSWHKSEYISSEKRLIKNSIFISIISPIFSLLQLFTNDLAYITLIYKFGA